MILSHHFRRIHRWLALFVGIQFLLWMLSGVYMVIMDISFIRGNTLTHPQTLVPISTVDYPISALLQRFPDASNIQLLTREKQTLYSFTIQSKKMSIDAQTGEILPFLTEKQAITIATTLYASNGTYHSASLLTENYPAELSPRHLPVWQINFNDGANTSLYVSAHTGQLVTQRHDYWRLFDFVWMLHIMDYDTREDIHNPILSIISLLALFTVISGLSLAIISIRTHPKLEADA